MWWCWSVMLAAGAGASTRPNRSASALPTRQSSRRRVHGDMHERHAEAGRRRLQQRRSGREERGGERPAASSAASVQRPASRAVVVCVQTASLRIERPWAPPAADHHGAQPAQSGCWLLWPATTHCTAAPRCCTTLLVSRLQPCCPLSAVRCLLSAVCCRQARLSGEALGPSRSVGFDVQRGGMPSLVSTVYPNRPPITRHRPPQLGQPMPAHTSPALCAVTPSANTCLVRCRIRLCFFHAFTFTCALQNGILPRYNHVPTMH